MVQAGVSLKWRVDRSNVCNSFPTAIQAANQEVQTAKMEVNRTPKDATEQTQKAQQNVSTAKAKQVKTEPSQWLAIPGKPEPLPSIRSIN